MTRRRLIVAIVAAVLCGMAWWLSLDRLSAEERLLVGTWNYKGKSSTVCTRMRLAPDRHCEFEWGQPGERRYFVDTWGQWFIRDGTVVIEGEASAVRRGGRPVLRAIGWPTNGAVSYPLDSIADDKLVVVMPAGTRQTWTRAPAE